MKFKFIKENRKEFHIGKMCKVLGVSRAGYHKYLKNIYSQRRIENQRLLELIVIIWENTHRSYGSRRIHSELRAMGLPYNRKRVERIMRTNNIKAKRRKKFKKTTNSKNSKYVAENLLKQNFSTDAPNKIWVSDITYIWTREGWLYLAVIMDLFSRLIVGWSMSNRINTQLVINSLNQAIINRNPQPGLIFHSDRGSQYGSDEFRSIISKNQFLQSMSGKGNCYDNAVVESFFHTIKTELVYTQNYRTRDEAKASIFEYIEIFYNKNRRHSTIDYLSPVDFELIFNKLVA